MPEFQWLQGPPHGSCFGCGTSSNDKGFVQTFADVDVMQNGEIVGYADVYFCANCLYAMGNLVGTATPAETEAFARRELDLIEETEKLKDEIMAWQQRFVQMSNLSSDDFEQLKTLKEETLDPGSDTKPSS